MPGNFESPSHAAVRAVARREPYAKALRDVPFRVGTVVDMPARYAELLIDAGCTVDAWETTYEHQLSGEHPVRIGSAALHCCRCASNSMTSNTNTSAKN